MKEAYRVGVALAPASLLGWTAAFVLLGLVFGNVAANIGTMLDSPQARAVITRLGGEKGIADAFLAAELGIIGVITSVYGVQAAMRLRFEETGLRAEPLLATPVGRISSALSHLAIAVLGTTVLLFGAGLAAGAAHAAHTGDGAQVGRVLAAPDRTRDGTADLGNAAADPTTARLLVNDAAVLSSPRPTRLFPHSGHTIASSLPRGKWRPRHGCAVAQRLSPRRVPAGADGRVRPPLLPACGGLAARQRLRSRLRIWDRSRPGSR